MKRCLINCYLREASWVDCKGSGFWGNGQQTAGGLTGRVLGCSSATGVSLRMTSALRSTFTQCSPITAPGGTTGPIELPPRLLSSRELGKPSQGLPIVIFIHNILRSFWSTPPSNSLRLRRWAHSARGLASTVPAVLLAGTLSSGAASAVPISYGRS